jgi:hypothetical protein
MLNNYFYLVAMIRPFQCEATMSMEVANEPPHLYLVEEEMQSVAYENNEIPEDELLLRK